MNISQELNYKDYGIEVYYDDNETGNYCYRVYRDGSIAYSQHHLESLRQCLDAAKAIINRLRQN